MSVSNKEMKCAPNNYCMLLLLLPLLLLLAAVEIESAFRQWSTNVWKGH